MENEIVYLMERNGVLLASSDNAPLWVPVSDIRQCVETGALTVRASKEIGIGELKARSIIVTLRALGILSVKGSPSLTMSTPDALAIIDAKLVVPNGIEAEK